MAEASPSVLEAANAPTTRAATRLPKLVAFAAHIVEPKNKAAAARKAGLLPM
jgi:hypothetical protein